MQRQPEIEVYISEYSPKRLMSWLEKMFGPLELKGKAGLATTYKSYIGPIIIAPKVEDGPFTSIWFNTPNSPWATDVDCARHVSKELDCVVRCCPGKHFPEVPQESNIFVEISDGKESLIAWQ